MGAPVEIAYFLLTSAGLCSRCRFPRQVISLRAHTDPAPDHAGAFALTVVVVMCLWWGWHACCRCGVGFCCVSSQLMAADPRRPFLFPSAFNRCRMCCPAHATSGQVSLLAAPTRRCHLFDGRPRLRGKAQQATAVDPQPRPRCAYSIRPATADAAPIDRDRLPRAILLQPSCVPRQTVGPGLAPR